MSLSPELQTKFDIWRRKSADNTITMEELREAVMALRGSRRSAAEASPTKSRSSRSPARSADDMLGDLMGGLGG